MTNEYSCHPLCTIYIPLLKLECFQNFLKERLQKNMFTLRQAVRFVRIAASRSTRFCLLITYSTFAFLHAWQPFYLFIESLISILLPSGKHFILSVKRMIHKLSYTVYTLDYKEALQEILHLIMRRYGAR